ncbi:hypothetical protein KFL_001480210 [Klebsormidium nitens]|uniref:Dirigent protein n=1 Tax=Klebsormidium nitens TaxID=105231 RepID=A0A1Y1I0F5_KLENI|nr:hypothetical protein KFL_001480210 [Klebsormidium nitens]|eukprot:GAQ83452.1 hypothetical protein KFL_001480210 [Klebsormidium nitens]
MAIGSKVVLLFAALLCIGHASAVALDYTEVRKELVEFSNATTQVVPGFNFGDQSYFRFISQDSPAQTNLKTSNHTFSSATNILQDIHTREEVGVSIGICEETTALNLATGFYELFCSFTFVFADGTIALQGQFLSTPNDIAIVGGTRAYTGATGIAHENTIAANPLTGEFTIGYNLRFYVLPKFTLPDLFLDVGVPPVNGACNPNSANPNQCFSAAGSDSICCQGQCPAQPGVSPACA